MSLVNFAFVAGALILAHMSPAIASTNCTPTTRNNASRFLNTFKEGYIKYITVDIGKLCITFTQTQFDATTKEAIYSVSSKSSSGTDNPTENQVFKVQECPSDIDISLQSNGLPLYNVTILYSDYTTCHVVQHHDETNACSMFVKKNARQFNIAACLPLYAMYCRSSYFEIYGAQCESA
uniref:Putative salivary lipocalin n=1 Tax=Ixodes ricinus TaxID=34613 RepID=A0A0K8R399_IXORI